MKRKTALLSILLVICMGFWSCSKDDSSDEPTGAVPCSSFLTEYETISLAQTTFSQNPTTENCEALKNAWLDFYEAFSDCPYWTNGDYQETIDNIQAMDCSDL